MQEAKVLLALIARRYNIQNVSGPVDWGACMHSCSTGPPWRTTRMLCVHELGGWSVWDRWLQHWEVRRKSAGTEAALFLCSRNLPCACYPSLGLLLLLYESMAMSTAELSMDALSGWVVQQGLEVHLQCLYKGNDRGLSASPSVAHAGVSPMKGFSTDRVWQDIHLKLTPHQYC